MLGPYWKDFEVEEGKTGESFLRLLFSNYTLETGLVLLPHESSFDEISNITFKKNIVKT